MRTILKDTQVQQIIALLRETGKAIMPQWGNTSDVKPVPPGMHPHDQTPLTQADLVAHQFIMDRLPRITPDIPIISEEGLVKDSLEIAENHDKIWIIDPLDGTDTFKRKGANFCCMLGLVQNGRARDGFIYYPVDDVVYYTDVDGRSYRQSFKDETTGELYAENDERRKPVVLQARPFGHTSRTAQTETRRFSRHSREIERKQPTVDNPIVASMNSRGAMPASLLALREEGKLLSLDQKRQRNGDRKPEWRRSRIISMLEGDCDICMGYHMQCGDWDIVAADALAHGAGAAITDLEGHRLTYGIKEKRNRPATYAHIGAFSQPVFVGSHVQNMRGLGIVKPLQEYWSYIPRAAGKEV